MDVLLILICICGLYRLRFAGKKFNVNYMSKQQTNAINGIFVLLIFFSHYSSYVQLGAHDMLMRTAVARLGQLIVVPFLFYSGYGVMYSLKNKENYYVSMPFKRIFRVWYHFAIAVALFIPVALILNKDYSIYEYIFAFTGWTSIGNSNWYVFAILCLYLFTYIGAKCFCNNHLKVVLTVFALSAIYILCMKLLQKGSWWYDTVICYPFGMLYSLYNTGINKAILRNSVWFALAVVTTLAVFVMLYLKIPVLYFSFIFAFWIVILTIKFKIGNNVWDFLGKYAFEIYILQRIPLTIFSGFIENRYIVFVLSFLATVILSVLFDRLLGYTDSLLYRNNEQN